MPERWERDLEEHVREPQAITQPSSQPKRLSFRLVSPISLNILLVVVALFLIVMILRQLQINPFGAITSMLTSLFNPTYTAQVPGPGCDHGAKANLWGAGNMHNEHKVDVNDPYTLLAYESYGLLITRTGAYNVYGDAFFGDVPDQPLPNNYSIQITAQVIHGDANAVVELSIHGQSKYGADSIEVNPNGQWWVTTFNNSTGRPETVLASGRLAQHASTITILADVHGPTVTVTINGEQVATISDPTYSTTSFLAFGVADSGATSNPSALFSNFVYMPQ
jgi:hypothetical protein